jgi:hypothetical protein
MNNIPITSRIQKKTKGGMVKDPLLNLGSPLAQKKTEVKKPTEETAESYIANSSDGSVGSETTSTITKPDTIVPGKEKKAVVLYKDLDPSIVEAAKKHNIDEFGTHNPTKEGKVDNTKGTGEFEDDIVIPGGTEKVKKNVTFKTAVTGTAKQPWESRFNSRNIKKTNKDVTTSQNKINRKKRQLKRNGATFNENTKEYENTGGMRQGKFDRLTTKYKENVRENDAFAGAAAVATAQSNQGKVAGEKVDLGERNTRLSEFKKPGIKQNDFKTQMRSGFKMKGYKK